MKTEKFEDKIRKKLESIEPEFQEANWLQFSAYSAGKLTNTTSFLGSNIFKIAASLAILGTLFVSIAQYNTQNKMQEKIAQLTKTNNHLVEKQLALEKIVSASNSNITTENESKTLTDLNNYSSLTSKKLQLNSTEQEHFTNKTSEINEKYLGVKESENSIFKNDLLGKNNKLLINQKNILRVSNGQLIANSKNNKGIQSENNYSSNNIISSNGNLINDNTWALNELKNINVKIDTSKKLLKALKNSDFAYFKIPANKKLYFSLADAYLRTGISGVIGRGNLNYGITAELFLDKRLSLSTGIRQKHIKWPTLLGEGQYNNISQKKFRDKYNLHNKQIKNVLRINQQSKISTVPIIANYNFEIKDGLKLIASLGTEIDVKVSKEISFNFNRENILGPMIQPIGPGDIEKSIITETPNIKAFNNVLIGAGIEKQFSKMAIQGKLIDYISSKDANYRQKNRLGLELGLYYKF
jgi:hypothetical protein